MNFNSLELKEELIEALNNNNITEMTPIQEIAIPKLLGGLDMIGQAPTGTGKTLAYSLPICNGIKGEKYSEALIICPTRELAIQVSGEIKKLVEKLDNINVVTLYGGQDIDIQLRGLRKGASILVGTPGRIIDHIHRKTINLSKLAYFVLDEADEMLNMGFIEDINEILKEVPKDSQKMFFSATMPKEITKLAETYLVNPALVKTLNNVHELPDIKQYYVELLEKNKIDCISRMLDAYNFKQALIFCRTKHNVDTLSMTLLDRGYKVESLHGDIAQEGREKVINMFKQGIIRVLIATDVAARGLDINGIDVVFNYDIPDDVEYYVHRIGRTARAGRTGSAYTFVNRKEVSRLNFFAKKLDTKITEITPPTYEEAKNAKINHLLLDLTDATYDDLDTYKSFINDFQAAYPEYDSLTLSAMLLKKSVSLDTAHGDQKEDITVKKSSKDKDSKEKGKKSSNKKRGITPGYTRIFLNLGEMDKLTKDTLKDLVCCKRHVNAKEVINIDILSSFSFFEIPDKQVDVVINMLNDDMYLNKRKVAAEVSDSTGNNKNKKDDKKGKRHDSGKKDGEKKSSKKEQKHSHKESYKDYVRNDKDKKSSNNNKKEEKKKKVKKPITKKRVNIEW